MRVNVEGRWRAGTAHLLPDDDARERLRTLARARFGARANLAVVRLVGTDLLTIRIDLEPAPRPAR